MDKSVWLLNERGAPYAYRAADGTVVRIANAAYLVIWHKRRERAKRREERREQEEAGATATTEM